MYLTAGYVLVIYFVHWSDAVYLISSGLFIAIVIGTIIYVNKKNNQE